MGAGRATISTEGLPSGLTPEDASEYSSRIRRLREVMRDQGYDAAIVGDSGAPHRWAGFLSGFVLPMVGSAGYRWQYSVVVLPLTGEPTLCVPSGIFGGIAEQARRRTQMRVLGTYSEDPAVAMRTRWGVLHPSHAEDVIRAVKDAGLEQGKIGLVGTWPGLDEVKSALPRAKFESASWFEPSGPMRKLANTVTPWGRKHLEVAQRAADSAMRALADAAQPGVTYDEAVNQAKIKLLEAGSAFDNNILLGVTSGKGDPWWFWVAGTQPTNARFKLGDMVNVEMITYAEGYGVQLCRSWVVGGKQSKSQARVIDAAKTGFEALMRRIEVGITGEQLWNATLEVFRPLDLEPFSRSGHTMGYLSGGGEGGTGRLLQFMPGNDYAVHEGHVFVVHPAAIDRGSLASAIIGDTVIIEDGQARLLSKEQLPLEIG
jgi:Xaa-Pro aminopeptidase